MDCGHFEVYRDSHLEENVAAQLDFLEKYL